ncbi:tetratricopeptide repeat protein [Caldifermentibacillus hisashii]|jgi:tetratricopeptide (TPR) repeat protein|uniref:helix-turn-helix domain-containing protein n=2 Tax=Caldifermentibacillus hisashii TaxID=996558 RepID=UPI0031FD21CD
MNNNLGSFLKLKRIEKNIRQDDLCRGICTPSYLSRIENNHVVADEEIYILLFERLGIAYDQLLESIEHIDEKIEKWYDSLLNKEEYEVNIEELKGLSIIGGGSTSIKFEIVYCRYLLEHDDLTEVSKVLKNLKQIIKVANNRTFFLYTNVLLLYYIKTNKFSEAVEAGVELLQLVGYENLANRFELGIFYYNFSLSLKNIYCYEEALIYIEKALKIFKDEYLLERALACHIILGTCYNNSRKWDDAIATFRLAERILIYLPKEDQNKYLYIISNNLGNCYEYQGKYNEAINYYLEAIKYVNDDNKSKIQLNLIRTYYLKGDIESARLWLKSKQAEEDSRLSEKYQIQLKIFETITDDNLTIDNIINIQKSSINYFLSIKDWKLTVRYSELFANIYESYSHYKQANLLYKLALQTNQNRRE